MFYPSMKFKYANKVMEKVKMFISLEMDAATPTYVTADFKTALISPLYYAIGV